MAAAESAGWESINTGTEKAGLPRNTGDRKVATKVAIGEDRRRGS